MHIEKVISKVQPEVIGFTAVSTNYSRIKDLAKKIRKASPSSILILRGVHITTSPNLFKNSPFDIGVRGEGEITLLRLLENIKKNKGIKINELKKIKGLMLRDAKQIIDNGVSERIENLDEFPLPAYDLLNMKYYQLPSLLSNGDPVSFILTSRGCPYSCKFCSSTCFWGSRVKFYSAERVVREIELIHRVYGFKIISFGDDIFSLDKNLVEKIIKILMEKRLLGKIKFMCSVRANLFDEERAKLLKKLGVTIISFGFESGSDKVLKYLKGENVSVEINRRAIELCKKHGILATGTFMIGSPYESLEEMEKTFRFIKNNLTDSTTFQTKPLPATKIWDYAIKNKIITEDYFEVERKEFFEIEPNILLTNKVDKKDFNEMYQKIKSLYIPNKRINLYKNIFSIKFISILFNPMFLKKAYSLRCRFIGRIKN